MVSVDQLSIEEFIKISPFENHNQQILALNGPLLPQNNDSYNFFERSNSIDPQNCNIGKHDLDVYLCNNEDSIGYSNDISHNLAVDNTLLQKFEQRSDEIANASSKSKHVPLSSSVAVPVLKPTQYSSSQIQVVHALEETFKPRYKSDYFSQDGTIRKPRYVADQKGNHYVSLRISPACAGFIRIDWVTIPDANNIRYSMPYKFQVNNDEHDNSDSNPIYKPIEFDKNGLIKLFLVLIKSKQDELKGLQSFDIFPPVNIPPTMNNLKSTLKLTAKTIIQNYQLDKSQLAFTHYVLSPDGQSFIPDWNTTVYSTVMTEMSTETSKKRKITCPECSHTFDITLDAINDTPHEKIIKKRK